jgi:hypothetical protein
LTPNTYRGNDVACLPLPCPITTGSCCRGATCLIVANAAACTGQYTRFVAAQLNCNAGTNSTTPCCRADFNKVNGITVQDVFDFLNAWLAGSTTADYTGNGAGAPTNQSVFDYVSAWFAGGCS